jgi:hypothetical protein
MATREFVVWEPAIEQECDGLHFDAESSSHAAEMWADWIDTASNEYRIVDGELVTVMVRAVNGGPTREMIVRGESIRRYSAE